MKVNTFELLFAVNFLCCLGLEGDKFGDSERSNEDEWLDPGDIFEYDRGKRVIHYFPLLPSFQIFKTICDELFSLEHAFCSVLALADNSCFRIELHFLVNFVTSSGHGIAPNTVANATKIIVLATQIQRLVAKLATRTL